MTSGALWGWIGGIAGVVLGLAGGIVGSYCAIHNTHGPHERAFAIRATAVTWLGMLVFFGLLLGLPSPYRWFVWLPYGILLPLGIVYGNRRQAEERARDLADASAVAPPSPQP